MTTHAEAVAAKTVGLLGGLWLWLLWKENR